VAKQSKRIGAIGEMMKQKDHRLSKGVLDLYEREIDGLERQVQCMALEIYRQQVSLKRMIEEQKDRKKQVEKLMRVVIQHHKCTS